MITRICCAHAGGQGKTTVAQALFTSALTSGQEIALASADFIDESGHSKLGRMFGDQVQEFGTGPSVSLAKESNDFSASVKYWDRLGGVLMKGNTIIDVGANVVDQLLNWGKIRRASELLKSRSAPPIDIFLVCKAERRAVDDMSDLVRRFGSDENLPVGRIFVVLNEQGGSFDGMDIRESLTKTAVKPDIEFINLPHCMSELWQPMEQRYVSLAKALELSADDVPDALGVDFWSVYSGLDDLRSWYDEVRAEFKRVGAI